MRDKWDDIIVFINWQRVKNRSRSRCTKMGQRNRFAPHFGGLAADAARVTFAIRDSAPSRGGGYSPCPPIIFTAPRQYLRPSVFTGWEKQGYSSFGRCNVDFNPFWCLWLMADFVIGIALMLMDSLWFPVAYCSHGSCWRLHFYD